MGKCCTFSYCMLPRLPNIDQCYTHARKVQLVDEINRLYARLSRACDGGCEKANKIRSLYGYKLVCGTANVGTHEELHQIVNWWLEAADGEAPAEVPIFYCWCGGKLGVPGA